MVDISASDDANAVINSLIQEKKLGWVILKLSADSKSIESESTGPRSADTKEFQVNWDGAKNALDAVQDQNRYALVEFHYLADDGRAASKIIFIHWNPDSASIMNRMKYASAKDKFKAKLNAVHAKVLQATSKADLSYDNVKSSLDFK